MWLDDARRWLLRTTAMPAPPTEVDVAALQLQFLDAARRRPMDVEPDEASWDEPEFGHLVRVVCAAVARVERRVDPAAVAQIVGWFGAGDTLDGREPPGLAFDGRLRWGAQRLVLEWFDQADRFGAWAEANQLLRGGFDLTEVGRAFCALQGRDALAFVLELEVAGSLGPTDRHRIHRRALGDVLAGSPSGSLRRPRFEQLGLVDADDRLVPEVEDLVRRVLDPAPNVIRALVMALREGELHDAGRRWIAFESSPDDAFARNLVHEIRNRLGPLSAAVDDLFRVLATDRPDPDEVSRDRERIERSLRGLRSWGEESVRLLETQQPSPFLLRDLGGDVFVGTEAERNGRVDLRLELGPERVVGVRARWTLALVNLVRNAVQAGARRVQVSSSREVGGGLRIAVDDDGPGVRPELLDTMFEAGVSGRGGSGQGLAQVARVVRSAGGQVTHEASPLGGARIVLRVSAEHTR